MHWYSLRSYFKCYKAPRIVLLALFKHCIICSFYFNKSFVEQTLRIQFCCLHCSTKFLCSTQLDGIRLHCQCTTLTFSLQNVIPKVSLPATTNTPFHSSIRWEKRLLIRYRSVENNFTSKIQGKVSARRSTWTLREKITIRKWRQLITKSCVYSIVLEKKHIIRQ